MIHEHTATSLFPFFFHSFSLLLVDFFFGLANSIFYWKMPDMKRNHADVCMLQQTIRKKRKSQEKKRRTNGIYFWFHKTWKYLCIAKIGLARIWFQFLFYSFLKMRKFCVLCIYGKSKRMNLKRRRKKCWC